jgi:hypothetical protein
LLSSATGPNVLDQLIYIRSPNLYTLPLELNLFRGPSFTQFNWLMAVSILTVIPVMVVFFMVQRAFVRGVTLTAVGGRWDGVHKISYTVSPIPVAVFGIDEMRAFSAAAGGLFSYGFYHVLCGGFYRHLER